MIDKKKLFAKGAPKIEQVKVPGVEDKLFVKGLSAALRGEMLQGLYVNGKLKEGKCFAAELVARCVVDAEGARIFDDADIPELGDMAQTFLDPLFDAANRLSGLDIKATEEAEKN